jgi:hypothetical protein
MEIEKSITLKSKGLFFSFFFSSILFQAYHIKSLCKYYANSFPLDPVAYEENLCPYKMTDVRRWGRLRPDPFLSHFLKKK